MDENRASAARKLPQTAANFFVGTNSRVPRMALAQSSHVLPIPLATSPARRPTSKVFLSRRKPVPFPSLSTSKETSNSPRSAASEGGKVARAVQHFTARADQGTQTPLESYDQRIELSAAPRRATSRVSSYKSSPSTVKVAMHSYTPERLQLSDEPSSASEPYTFASGSASALSDPAKARIPKTEPQEQFTDLAIHSAAEHHRTGRLYKSAELPVEDMLASLPQTNSQAEQISAVDEKVHLLVEALSLPASPAVHLGNDVSWSCHPVRTDVRYTTISDIGGDNSGSFNARSMSSVLSNVEHGQNLVQVEVGDDPSVPSAVPERDEEPSQGRYSRYYKQAATVEASSIMPKSDCMNETLLDTRVRPVSLDLVSDSTETKTTLPSSLKVGAPNSVLLGTMAPSPSSVSNQRVPEETKVHASHLSNANCQQLVRKAEQQHLVAVSPPNSPGVFAASEEEANLSCAQSSSTPSLSSSRHKCHLAERIMKTSWSPELGHHVPSTAPDIALCSHQSHNFKSVIEQEKGSRAEGNVMGVPPLHISDHFSGLPRQESDSMVDEEPFWVADQAQDTWATVEPLDLEVTSRDLLHTESEDFRNGQELPWSARTQKVKYSGTDCPDSNDDASQKTKTPRNYLSQNAGSNQLPDMTQSPSMSGEVLFELIEEARAPASTSDKLMPRDSLIKRTTSWVQRTLEEQDQTSLAPFDSQGDQDDEDDQDDQDAQDIEDEQLTVAYPTLSELIHEAIGAETADRSRSAKPSTASVLYSGTSAGEALKCNALKGALLEQPSDFVKDKAALFNGKSNNNIQCSDGEGIDPSQDHDFNQPRSQHIGRSYSQRFQLGKSAAKLARRIPDRLRIPERQEEVGVRVRRQSLELLPARDLAAARTSQQSASSHAGGRSPQCKGAVRSSHFEEMLSSWLHLEHATSGENSPSSCPRPRVQRMIKHGSESPSSREEEEEEEEEVASIAVCERMTFKRMSDFTFHSTPGGEAWQFPGKLRQRGAESTPAHLLQRPASTFREPPPQPASQSLHARKKAVGVPVQEVQGSLLPVGDLVWDRTDGTAPASLQDTRRPQTAQSVPHETEVSEDVEPSLPLRSSAVDVCEPREVIRPLQSVVREEHDHLQVDRWKQSASATLSPNTRTLKPLRLQTSHSVLSTPKRANVSVTNTSPHTVLSELWTPDTSNPANSAVTEPTGTSTSVGSSSLSARRGSMKRRLVDYMHHLDSEAPAHPARHSQPWSRDPICQQTAVSCREGSICACRHGLSLNVQAEGNHDPIGASCDRRAQDTNLESDTSRQRQGSTASTEVHAAVYPTSSFDVSVQLQEPKLAPNCADGTLFELGLRVLIKPSGESSVYTSGWFKPPTALAQDARLRSPQRERQNVDARQYIYNNLPPAEMSRVQEEAQEHLRHAFASPHPHGRRITSSGLRLSPISSNSPDSERGLSSPFSGTNRVSRHFTQSSRQQRKDATVTRSQRPSPSPLTFNTGNMSSIAHPSTASLPMHRRRPSTTLTSPLPYIKRAPPRTISSTVSVHSVS